MKTFGILKSNSTQAEDKYSDNINLLNEQESEKKQCIILT